MKPATQLIHVAEGINTDASPLTTPIYETTTFLFENAQEVLDYNEGRSKKFLYSRYENPTVLAVERRIAALEGAAGALVFSSGQAATTTALLGLLAAGDELVCSAAIYGGTLHLIADILPKFGIKPRFVSIEELRQPDTICSASTKLVWFESPINPTLRCVDIAAVAAACRARGVTSVVDNTFASPINQQPLALGVDVVMHSATKYLNGHSDVTAGVLAGSSEVMAKVLKARKLVGAVLDPYAAYALGRGLKTLAVRVERQNASALAIAETARAARACGARLLPGSRVAPRSRHREAPDDRLRRDGLPGRRRRLRSRGAVLRPATGDQAGRQPWRRREPLQPAGADVAVGPLRGGTCPGRRDQEHGADLRGPRGS